MDTSESRTGSSIIASERALTDAERARQPSALNLPNIITLSRLFLALVLFAMIDRAQWWKSSALLFIFASATDAVDGYIARKYGMVTKIGRVLDPFVDKVIVCGALIFLVEKRQSGVNAWIVLIIIGREMFVTGLRSFLEQEGKDFSAALSGKIKMILQCVAISACLLSLSPELNPDHPDSLHNLALGFRWFRDLTLWSAVAATLYSGYIYVIRAISLFRESP